MASPSPVFRSMVDPIKFVKIPFTYFLGLAFITVLLVILTSSALICLSALVVGYIFGVIMTKKDPRWVEVLYARFLASDLDMKEERKYVA